MFPGATGGVAVHDLLEDETRVEAAAYDLTSLAVSPDGSRVLALHGEHDEGGVAVVDLDSGEPYEVTPAGSKDRRLQWSADGERVLFHRVFGTWQEQPTLAMVADARTGTIERLTDADPDVVRSEAAWWSFDGEWTLVLEGHPRYPLRLIARTNAQTVTVIDDEVIALVLPSPSTNELFVAVEDAENQTTALAFEARIHDLDTAVTSELATDHGVTLSSGAEWSPTRREIAFARQVAHEDGNYVRLSLLDLDSGESRIIAELTEYETVWALGFSADGEQIVMTVKSYEPDAGAVMLAERSTGDVRTVVRRRDSRFTYATWRPHFECD